ncbi:MAG: hypothetical protein ACQKBU_01390 [Verrucomicrobiales bacterium]
MPSQNNVGAILANAYDSASRSIRQGGAATGAGYASFGRSMGQGIQGAAYVSEDRKKKEGVAKSVKAMAEADPQFAAAMGINPQEFDNYSTNDLLGRLDALKAKSQVGQIALEKATLDRINRTNQETVRMNEMGDRLLRMADQADQGVGVLKPEAVELAKKFASSPAGQARRMGVNLTPEVLARFSQGQQQTFRPEIVEMGGGMKAMMTSPQSAVPIKPGQTSADPGTGPQISEDGKFYLKGGEWTPVPRSGGDGLDPMVRESYVNQRATLQQEIAELQRQAAQTPENPWGPNWARTTRADVNRQIQEKRRALAGVEAALVISGDSSVGMTPAQAPAAPVQQSGFSFDGLTF